MKIVEKSEPQLLSVLTYSIVMHTEMSLQIYKFSGMQMKPSNSSYTFAQNCIEETIENH